MYKANVSSIRKLVPLTLVFVLAIVVFKQYGFAGELRHDHAIFLYSGQQMAEGIPPYVSIFDNKGPLAPMLAGLGVEISSLLGWSDILTVRMAFSLVGCFAVASVYLLGSSFFRSQRVGFFAALSLLGFFGFVHLATSIGPEPKVPVVLFEALSLILMSRRQWFWAGLCGSLSMLFWQPTAVLPLVTLLLAVVQSPERRAVALVRAAVGIGLPLGVVSAYFHYHGAFYEMLDGFVLFNFLYSVRGPSLLEDPLSHFLRPIGIAFTAYRVMFLPIFIGFTMIVYACYSRVVSWSSYRELLFKDTFAPIALTFPAFILLSLLDFQGPADFFVLLPYAAIGFGAFLDLAIRGTDASERTLPPLREGVEVRGLLTVGISILLLGLATINGSATINPELAKSRARYAQQKQAAQQIEDRFGRDAKLMSLGAPYTLVLLHRTNPTPYGFIKAGIDRRIQSRTPGGFAGWIRESEAYDPDVIVFNGGQLQALRENHEETLMDWLNSNYREDQIGPWKIYVKPPMNE